MQSNLAKRSAVEQVRLSPEAKAIRLGSLVRRLLEQPAYEQRDALAAFKAFRTMRRRMR